MTTTPPYMPTRTVDFIVRVSRIGYRSATLDSDKEQLRQLHAWAGPAGYTVGMIHVEKDVSGKTTNRKALNAARKRVMDGTVDAIAACYVSRFSRNTLEGLELVHDVLGAGREFIPLDLLGMDLRSPAGEQFLTMKLAEARAEWRVRKETFDHYRGKAIARGVHLTERFGYRKGDDGKLVPCSVESPWVEPIYLRRAGRIVAPDGQARAWSWPELAAWLNSEGVKPHRFSDTKMGEKTRRKMGEKWTHNRVKALVESRTYLGEARSGDDNVNPDAHVALVSVELWNACDALRDLRPRRGKAEYELSSILRCAACNGPMNGSTTTKKNVAGDKAYRYYKCQDSACKAGKVKAEVVEAFVHGELAPVVAGLRAVGRERTGTLDGALAHLADMEAMRADVAGDLELRALDRDAYRDAVVEAAKRVTNAKAKVRQTRATVTGVSITPEHVAGWTDLPVDVRRRFLAEAFQAVYVAPSRDAFAVIGRGELADTEHVASLFAGVI